MKTLLKRAARAVNRAASEFVRQSNRDDAAFAEWVNRALTPKPAPAGPTLRAATGVLVLTRVAIVLTSMAVVGAYALVPAPHIVVPLAVIAFLVANFSLLFGTGSLLVADDGVHLRDIGRRRFVPFHAITSVDEDGEWLTIHRANGRPIRTRIVTGTCMRAAVAARIRERIGTAPPAPIPAALEPIGEDAHAWIAQLQSIDATPYRGLSNDALWSLVEDPTADQTTRAAASIALAPRMRDDEPRRLRIAAERIAAPALRLVIERVAERDDDGAERAIQRLHWGRPS